MHESYATTTHTRHYQPRPPTTNQPPTNHQPTNHQLPTNRQPRLTRHNHLCTLSNNSRPCYCWEVGSTGTTISTRVPTRFHGLPPTPAQQQQQQQQQLERKKNFKNMFQKYFPSASKKNSSASMTYFAKLRGFAMVFVRGRAVVFVFSFLFRLALFLFLRQWFRTHRRLLTTTRSRRSGEGGRWFYVVRYNVHLKFSI